MQDNSNHSFENILPAINLIRENASAIGEITADPGKAQAFLSDALGLSQAQASETIYALELGLTTYQLNKEAAEASDGAVGDGIRNALKDYSNQERITILANVLTALQLGASADENRDVAALRSSNEALTEDELIEAIEASLGSLPFEAVFEAAGKNFSLQSVGAIADLRTLCSADYKLAAAVLLFVEQQSGNLALEADGTTLPAEALGAMAGASIDAIIATMELNQGRITLKKWQRILKWIVGGLFVAVFSAISAVAILTLCFGIMYVFGAIFGGGIITTSLACLAMFAVLFKALPMQDELLECAIDRMSEVYDKAIVKVTEWANRLGAAIRNFISSSNSTKAQEQAENKIISNTTKADTDVDVDADLTIQPA